MLEDPGPMLLSNRFAVPAVCLLLRRRFRALFMAPCLVRKSVRKRSDGTTTLKSWPKPTTTNLRSKQQQRRRTRRWCRSLSKTKLATSWSKDKKRNPPGYRPHTLVTVGLVFTAFWALCPDVEKATMLGGQFDHLVRYYHSASRHVKRAVEPEQLFKPGNHIWVGFLTSCHARPKPARVLAASSSAAVCCSTPSFPHTWTHQSPTPTKEPTPAPTNHQAGLQEGGKLTRAPTTRSATTPSWTSSRPPQPPRHTKPVSKACGDDNFDRRPTRALSSSTYIPPLYSYTSGATFTSAR